MRFKLPPIAVDSDVVRLITFQRLGLRHTCCYLETLELDYKVGSPDPGEATELREEDHDRTPLLELLVQEFQDSGGARDLRAFIKGDWSKRMRELHAARNQEVVDVVALRDVGVIPYNHNEHDDPWGPSYHDSEDEYEPISSHDDTDEDPLSTTESKEKDNSDGNFYDAPAAINTTTYKTLPEHQISHRPVVRYLSYAATPDHVSTRSLRRLINVKRCRRSVPAGRSIIRMQQGRYGRHRKVPKRLKNGTLANCEASRIQYLNLSAEASH